MPLLVRQRDVRGDGEAPRHGRAPVLPVATRVRMAPEEAYGQHAELGGGVGRALGAVAVGRRRAPQALGEDAPHGGDARGDDDDVLLDQAPVDKCYYVPD